MIRTWNMEDWGVKAGACGRVEDGRTLADVRARGRGVADGEWRMAIGDRPSEMIAERLRETTEGQVLNSSPRPIGGRVFRIVRLMVIGGQAFRNDCQTTGGQVLGGDRPEERCGRVAGRAVAGNGSRMRAVSGTTLPGPVSLVSARSPEIGRIPSLGEDLRPQVREGSLKVARWRATLPLPKPVPVPYLPAAFGA